MLFEGRLLIKVCRFVLLFFSKESFIRLEYVGFMYIYDCAILFVNDLNGNVC